MIAPARRAAADALAIIDAGDLDMGSAIARARAGLHDERDRALLLEIVTGTLRMQAAIDYQVAARVKRPLARLDTAVLRVLRMSAFQLIYLSRLPASAIINDAVELTRRSGKSSAAGLTNAVLRSVSRDRAALSWPSRADVGEHLSIVLSHPRWLVDRWLQRYGEHATGAWLAFNNEPAAMCLSVNRHLTTRDALAGELADVGVRTEPTRPCGQRPSRDRGAPSRAPRRSPRDGSSYRMRPRSSSPSWPRRPRAPQFSTSAHRRVARR